MIIISIDELVAAQDENGYIHVDDIIKLQSTIIPAVEREDVIDKLLEIIDTAQTYKMYPGQKDTYIDKRVLREAVEALRGEQ